MDNALFDFNAGGKKKYESDSAHILSVAIH